MEILDDGTFINAKKGDFEELHFKQLSRASFKGNPGSVLGTMLRDGREGSNVVVSNRSPSLKPPW